METLAGAAVGAAVAGPVGALAGGLAASKLDTVGKRADRDRRAQLRAAERPDDPLIHARPRRILVPLDFSPPSKRAMRFARAWAEFFSAEVCLLHVVEPPVTVGELGTGPAGVVQRDIPGKAEAALRELADAEFPASSAVRVMVRRGTAFDQIAAAARETRADLIIVATHGRTGLSRVLLGSTAERVARHAPCPVLILRRRAG